MSEQQPDPRPGFYYVSVVDGQRTGLLMGPFVDDHAGALAAVGSARDQAIEVSTWAHFYAFGTIRCVDDRGSGMFGGDTMLRDPDEVNHG